MTEGVRNGLWVIPTGFMVGAVVLGLALRQLDHALGDVDLPSFFEDDPASAQSLLGVIATSIMTFTSLVISVTVVALQLASQQFSPRILRTFFRDTRTKVALGVFVGTFVYTLVVLRQLDPNVAADDVPRISVGVGFALALVSLGTFVFYVNHVVHAIRIVSIIDAVAAETRAAIREVHVAGEPPAPAEVPARAPDLLLTSERAPGAITTVDEDDLVDLAARHRCLIRLVPRVGEFVPSGAPLAEVWAMDDDDRGDHDVPAPGLTAAEVLAHIGLARERTMSQDVAFGLRQLVDIAEKALSPAVNDPTTASQVLDRLHDLLRRIALAPEPSGYFRSHDRVLRLVVPVATWPALVGLACDEIRVYGAGTHQVQRKMRVMLADLHSVVDDERDVPLARQLRLLDAAVDRHFPDPEDRAAVRQGGFEC